MDIIGKISEKNGREVEWTVENFCAYSGVGREYASPNFKVCDSMWFLAVHPNGRKSDNSSGFVSLYLYGIGVSAAPLAVCLSFGIKKRDETVEQFGDNFTWVFEVAYDACGSPKFLQRSELDRRRDELAPEFAVTFTCTLRTQKDWFESPAKSLDTLSLNLMDLSNSRRGCDTTLMVKGKSFAVHRWVMTGRSSVFASMFEVEMSEKRTGTVDISDCDPAAFEEFLTYLYTGRLEGESRHAIELYKIAHKYDVEDLRVYCCLCIMLALSADNVLETFLLAHQFDEQTLRLRAQYFFVVNFDQIVTTEKWDEVLAKNTDLANKLLKYMTEIKKMN